MKTTKGEEMKIRITIEEVDNSFNKSTAELSAPVDFPEFVKIMNRMAKKVFQDLLKKGIYEQ